MLLLLLKIAVFSAAGTALLLLALILVVRRGLERLRPVLQDRLTGLSSIGHDWRLNVTAFVLGSLGLELLGHRLTVVARGVRVEVELQPRGKGVTRTGKSFSTIRTWQ
jgi:hypothetical protein